MSSNWLNFKANLGSNSVAYIDDEGCKIPIESEYEFDEAIRFAKVNGNHLKLILTPDKSSSDETILFFNENGKVNPELLIDGKKKGKPKVCIMKFRDNKCQCEDGPPEWFTHYMKKFKKELMQELKSSVHETIYEELEKDKKHKKTEITDTQCEEKNFLSSPANKQKKKKFDKDCGDQILEQREVKLLKKIEKLHPSKFERLESRLEKLDNKTRLLLEERRKLLEKKRCFKSKLERKCSEIPDKKGLKAGKSALFLGNEKKITVAPGMKFSMTLQIMNDGADPWVFPMLECLAADGFVLSKSYQYLPKLKPRDVCFIDLEGNVTDVPGKYQFSCRVVDGLEDLGSQVVCWAEVVPPEFDTPIQSLSSIPQEDKINENPNEKPATTTVNDFINFDENILTNCQKKIEENINEIEKRFHDIDLLLSPNSSIKLNKKRSNEETHKVDLMKKQPSVDFLMTSCDMLQNDKGNSTRAEFTEISFVDSPHNGKMRDNVDIKVDAISDKKKDSCSEKIESVATEKKGESESDSDSELSVILLSEEEDNFIVVPLPSKSPSSGPEVSADEKVENSASVSQSFESGTAEVLLKDANPKSDNIETVTAEVEKVVISSEPEVIPQPSCAKNRQSPFAEERADFKTKKIKSSTEYQFTASNLTQPTFSAYPETRTGGQSTTFTFTGTNVKAEGKPRDVPTTDSCGRIIYAVNTKGYCLPVGSLIGNESRTSRRNSESGKKNESAKQSERKSGRDENSGQSRFDKCNGETSNEIPAVNILPNVLMNGASSVASLALNTAKSVINNLQSAFIAEGKTEMGKPACEQKKPNGVSMEAMFKLYEMGFGDLQTNRKLLLIHDNDLSKVVEELIILGEKRSGQPRQEE